MLGVQKVVNPYMSPVNQKIKNLCLTKVLELTSNQVFQGAQEP